MYIICTVTDWKDQRDSSYRIAPLDAGSREILLNPSHMSEIKADTASPLTKSNFKYFDNHLDRREGPSFIKANETVAAIVAASNTAFHSTMITLPIHKNNNPNAATTDHTMPVDCISWMQDYNPLGDPDTHCWCVYCNAAFKRREVLVNYSLEEIIDIAETGTTSTTTTTSTTHE